MIHSEPAEYAAWLKLIFLIPVGLAVGGLVSLYHPDIELSLSLLGEALFFLLLFYFILPRKFEIYHDKIVIVLGPPLNIGISYSSIKEVRHSSGAKAYFFGGVRFATSTRYVIEIIRSRGLDYVISPKNGDVFLEQLNQAISTFRSM